MAVVTGAAQGIGRALAVQLAQDGHRVVLGDLQSTQETEAEAGQLGVPVFAVQADVADQDAVSRLESAVPERFGRCGVLVNNAATGKPEAFEDMTSAT